MKEPGKRQKQFASVLKNALAHNIRAIVPQNCAHPDTLFSIGNVIVSADLRNAKIEIICAKESAAENLKKLRDFAPLIRKKSASFLHTKYVPEIRFVHTVYPQHDLFHTP